MSTIIIAMAAFYLLKSLLSLVYTAKGGKVTRWSSGELAVATLLYGGLGGCLLYIGLSWAP